MKHRLKIGALVAVFITLLFSNFSNTTLADVTEIDYDSPSFVETDNQELDNNNSADTGDSRNWFEKLLDKIKDKAYDGTEYLLGEWEKFEDWSAEKWKDFKEWVPGAWDITKEWVWGVIEDVGDFFVWVWENEWVQVVVGAVVATGVVIGGLLLIGTPIGWGILAVVGGGALLAGGIYKLFAGDNFSFLGSLSWSLLGGLSGLGIYAGVTSGFFALVGGTLRTTAMRGFAASRIFILDGLVKLRLMGSLVTVLVKRKIIGGWTAAVAWAKSGVSLLGNKIVSGWAYVSSQIARAFGAVTSKIAPYGWKALASMAAKSGLFGAGFNAWLYLALTPVSERNLKHLLIDTVIGGISGVLLSPFLYLEKMTKGAYAFLSGYAGMENFLAEGIKNGTWLWENIVIGAVAGAIVIRGASPYLSKGTQALKNLVMGEKIPLSKIDDIIIDNATKPFSSEIRSELNDKINPNDIPDSKPEPQPDPKPEPQPDPKPEPQPDPKPEPQPDSKPEPQPDPKPEPQPDSKPEPQPDPKPEPQPDPKPEPQPDSKPEPQPDPKPEPQPDPKPEPQPDPKPEPQPDPKPEPQPDHPVDDGNEEQIQGGEELDPVQEVDDTDSSSDEISDGKQNESKEEVLSGNEKNGENKRFDGLQPSFTN
ncbi:hypothetical protein [Sporosarcina sp. FSL K6-1508]|uniref:hypothetical protein n=1 Tax=Sporosarcina sp. FSL K6-1508 TaxID=2921553 RepID=UPI0030FAE60B